MAKKINRIVTQPVYVMMIVCQILGALCSLWAVVFMGTNMRLLELFCVDFLSNTVGISVFSVIYNFINDNLLVLVYLMNITQFILSSYRVYQLISRGVVEDDFRRGYVDVSFNVPGIIPEIVYSSIHETIRMRINKKNQSKNVAPKKVNVAKIPNKFSVKQKVFAIAYIVWYFVCQMPLALFVSNLMPEDFNIIAMTAIFIALDLFLLVVPGIFIFREELLPGIKDFVKNFKFYFKTVVPKFFLFVLGMWAVNVVLLVVFNSKAANQELLENDSYPIVYLVWGALIFAPIVEECVFRNALSRFIGNDRIFMITSAVTFGLLHTYSSEETLLRVVLYAIPYAILGFGLAYYRRKTNNPIVNTFLHFIVNAIGLVAMVISSLMIM